MAHRFKIMDDTGTLTTYTDYDSIPLSTLKHVIAFEPDLGTEVAANEMLLENGEDKIVPEDFATGDENHLMLETASDDQTTNHYHPPTGPHHTDGDGHTEAEHRELALWNYKLQLLMIQERS